MFWSVCHGFYYDWLGKRHPPGDVNSDRMALTNRSLSWSPDVQPISKVVKKMDIYNREPGDMNDRESGGFHVQYMSSDMHVWIKTFFKFWTELIWLALKVVFLTGPVLLRHARVVDRLRDSIHTKRRNRLGQELVERLVRTHANLKLE